MCGIAGIYDCAGQATPDRSILERMTAPLTHRGPDASGYYVDTGVGLGFRRLAIVDLTTGDQPMASEDGMVVSVCNGELFNYRALKADLAARGHVFKTQCDCEVLPHLYEEYGLGLLDRLDGQFSCAIHDRRAKRLCLARDPFGITPLYYTRVGDLLLFASEIKGLLAHPGVVRGVDLTGLDQVLSFPGAVSPRTVFKNVQSLGPGQYLVADASGIRVGEYWDLVYPALGEHDEARDERYYIEGLRDVWRASVEKRLLADVEVGVYLSGGLDSSFVAGMMRAVAPDVRRHSFSVAFEDVEMSEAPYQARMADATGFAHHVAPFGLGDVVSRLEQAVYHAESPLKETHDAASLVLAEHAKAHGVTVILTGQGADELFAGYIGYRFDQFQAGQAHHNGLSPREREIRERLWGDPNLVYDGDYAGLAALKSDLYAPDLSAQLHAFDSLQMEPINKDRLRGRHLLHKRSYLDFKLRLADHLLTDHGDRMAMAHSVEVRHPFLDKDLVRFATTIPPHFKLNGFTEKYVVKEAARPFVPEEVIEREKFGWYAPGSPALLQARCEWAWDLLSYERIRRQGYFNADTVERLKRTYAEEGFALAQPFETDWLTIVLTFSLLVDRFGLPTLS